MNDIRQRTAVLKSAMGDSARRAGRNPADISLILVTKTVDVERIRLAYDAGHRDFGENRVQELRPARPNEPISLSRLCCVYLWLSF